MSSLLPFPSETLRALLARLIPADEFPGAVEAGTENYILRQLKGDCSAEAPALLRGLDLLDAEAQTRFGKRFPTLAPAEQDFLLGELENFRTSVAWPAELSSAAFFARMVDLAHEGFYADPANGGNRDAVSWRMIGYDPRISVSPGDQSPPASKTDSAFPATHLPSRVS